MNPLLAQYLIQALRGENPEAADSRLRMSRITTADTDPLNGVDAIRLATQVASGDVDYTDMNNSDGTVTFAFGVTGSGFGQGTWLN